MEDVFLFCNRDTVIDDFKDASVPGGLNLELIIRSLLVPYFSMRARILERGNCFKIGDMEFYVASCEPFEYGKVTSRTTLRCPVAISKSEPLQRINLAPLRRLEVSRTILMENSVRPYFEANIDANLYKNMVIEIED